MNVNSSHAAGRSAYIRQTNPSQETEQSIQSTADSETPSSAKETAERTAIQEQEDKTLTSQEQQMIEENFPEDPELSMRLYGQGQGTGTVHPDAVGRNLDVTG